MSCNIPYTVHKAKDKTVYFVNGHYFQIFYRKSPIPVTSDMITEMASFADEETKEGNLSFPNNAIPFEIWDENNYLAW